MTTPETEPEEAGERRASVRYLGPRQWQVSRYNEDGSLQKRFIVIAKWRAKRAALRWVHHHVPPLR